MKVFMLLFFTLEVRLEEGFFFLIPEIWPVHYLSEQCVGSCLFWLRKNNWAFFPPFALIPLPWHY